RAADVVSCRREGRGSAARDGTGRSRQIGTRMTCLIRLLSLLWLLLTAMAQQPTDRLLVLEHPDAGDLVPAPRAIPRSYALVIGISEYPNLSVDRQLLYGVRDAEAIYRVLISPEGGNFRAENVHLLLGADANLANIHHELEDWLVKAASDEDRVV